MIDHIKFTGMMLCLFASALAGGLERGDPAQVYEYPSNQKPCSKGFGDWPESYDMECE